MVNVKDEISVGEVQKKMKTKKRVSKNLKAIMEELGYTKKELAYRSGVSYPFLRGIVNGSANVSVDILDKICEELDVDITKLVEEPL